MVGKAAGVMSPSALEKLIRENKTEKHRTCERYQKKVASNLPGITLHGTKLQQPHKPLIDKLYRKRRLE